MPAIATLATVRRLAQRLPDVAEGTSYGTPAWRVRGKFFARMREEGETLVVKVEPEEKPLLMASEPEIFCDTKAGRRPRFLLYPALRSPPADHEHRELNAARATRSR